MFCNSEYIKEPYDLSCGKRWVPEIISLISIFFSLFVLVVTIKKVKLSLLNKLILQIIASEIIDGLNILLCAISDAQGKPLFENYTNRRYICFSQIYLGLFTCLWTLTASLFISLRMYDIMIKRNKDFQHFLRKNATTLSILIPAIISYVIWIIQVQKQSAKPLLMSEKDFYNPQGIKREHFKYMYCWVDKTLNFIILGIVLFLIIMNIYFSIIRGSNYLSNISNGYKEKENGGRASIKKQIETIDHVKYTLWIYPIASCVIWGIFFIFQVICDEIEVNIDGPLAWVHILLISVRQPIYTFMFCYTQRKIKECCLDTLFCQNRKSAEQKTEPQLTQIKAGTPVLPDDNLIA